ncbi:MAG TPA: hypothetical protein VM737_00995 [Gemmatimonadota bacterium]|nr:hypothetical protein [Gemmatimonadota bacterium]
MRKRIRTATRLGLMILPVAFSTACNGDNGVTDPPPGPDPPGPGPQTAILEGDVRTTRTLSPDTTYTILGFLEVQPGGELVIPAGTLLLSDPNTKGTIVTLRCEGDQPSGRLVVQGTAANPVHFRPAVDGPLSRGQAGGIVLHGCAPINQPIPAVSEGVARPFGGDDPNDSSGEIRYLTIEFGGVKVTPDNEINGLTMSGVGDGTIIEFVQTHFIADDGFEWFGGTVHGRNLVSTGNDDDSFDCDFGWNGTIQFIVAIQDRNLANRGVECDNDGAGSNNLPFTEPNVWNGTWVGTGIERANNEINDGLYLRRNISGTWRNLIVTNFGNAGAVFDGTGVVGKLGTGELVLDNVLFFNNRCLSSPEACGGGGPIDDIVYRLDGAYTSAGVGAQFAGATILEGDPLFGSVDYDNPMNGTAPNLLPVAGSPALDPANAATPTGPAIDPSATFLGAFDGTDNWMAGWTVWNTQ